MPFEHGQSGNPSGTKRDKKFLAALERANAQDNGEKLRKCAETVLSEAAAGVPWAVQFLADRLDGKASQEVVGSGEGGAHTFELKAPWIEAIAKARGWA